MAQPWSALNPNANLAPRQEFRKPKIKQDRACYGVMNNGFFDVNDKFRFPGSIIYHDSEPNQNLYPMNKLAYDKMQEFLDKVDKFGEQAAKMNKKTYIPQPRQEWREFDDDSELPAPQYVMGVPKADGREDEAR